jgi:hypothetical protein
MTKAQIPSSATQSRNSPFTNKPKRMLYIRMKKQAYATLMKMKEADDGKLRRGHIKALAHG